MKWKPVDVVVVMVCVPLVVVPIGVLIKGVVMREELEQGRAAIMASILGALISIVALYVGAKLKGDKQ